MAESQAATELGINKFGESAYGFYPGGSGTGQPFGSHLLLSLRGFFSSVAHQLVDKLGGGLSVEFKSVSCTFGKVMNPKRQVYPGRSALYVPLSQPLEATGFLGKDRMDFGS